MDKQRKPLEKLCVGQLAKSQSRKRKHDRITDSDDTDYERPLKKSSKLSSPSPERCVKEATAPLSGSRLAATEHNLTSPIEYHSQSSSVISLSDTSPPTSSVFNYSPSTDDASKDSWHAVKGNETPQSVASSCSNDSTSLSSANVTLIEAKICKYNMPCSVTPNAEQRLCTLPRLNFAEADEVWKLMCRQDDKGSLDRDASMLQRHKGIQPRMRAILLDWLIEVCEVYKLRRETYYLAVDYLDRYLTNVSQAVLKNHLQLIGISCLFIAAKVEEIYPPKLNEFAYVTDGACAEDDILRQELLILSTLQWKICPVTVVGWLSLYMQINVTTNLQNPDAPNAGLSTSCKKSAQKQTKSRRKSIADQVLHENRQAEAFVFPQFSGMEYTQVMQLVDLCSLDVEMAVFPYSVVAAAAISHIFDRTTATRLSGLNWDQIHECARWMKPFYDVINEESGPIFLLEQNEQISSPSGLKHICPNIVTDESHTIQTHRTSLKMFDTAMEYRLKQESERIASQPEESPATALAKSVGLLTPPASNRKSLGACASSTSKTTKV
ncbi:G1/S-specific cyclin-E-like isoform X1 [Culicoides brevitarsis]|uniref:G1/S-specific cyclin-E-like isoform X1 n=1 Tax=Culicoides brevitarsis TaxID=469753 RepID=UPI00307BC066